MKKKYIYLVWVSGNKWSKMAIFNVFVETYLLLEFLTDFDEIGSKLFGISFLRDLPLGFLKFCLKFSESGKIYNKASKTHFLMLCCIFCHFMKIWVKISKNPTVNLWKTIIQTICFKFHQNRSKTLGEDRFLRKHSYIQKSPEISR